MDLIIVLHYLFQESNVAVQVECASSMNVKDLLNITGEYCDMYIVERGFY